MNASTEIAAQLDHIVSGKCQWVPRPPKFVAAFAYRQPIPQACLVERCSQDGKYIDRFSVAATLPVARAIAELYPEYSCTTADWSPDTAHENQQHLYVFCTNWNDHPADHEDPRSEAQVIEVLERGLKYALIDEGM